MNSRTTVLERYSRGAKELQSELCCPVSYDPELVRLLPMEIVEKDYGCGDPSRYVREDDVVLDLGSGSGKICYIAAQLVGERGRVIGVDMNEDMLALARKYQGEMADKLGGNRVRFVKGYIHDLALDLEALDLYLARHPVRALANRDAPRDWQARQRSEAPLIPDGSVDVVISNCVLNLVAEEDKQQLIREIHRVLKPGGRVAIADIVSDEPIPDALKKDPELWSGCVSGAFQEQAFLKAFIDAGFLAVSFDKWEPEPWQVVENIEFRSVTLTAVKGEGTACLDVGQAVIYRGPFACVTDDEGHLYPRGERMAVCERTFRLLTQGPYKDDFIGIAAATARDPVPWCAAAGTKRPASASKGATHTSAYTSAECCK